MYIGELAKISGVSRDTIRHYLDLGLIGAGRNPDNGYQVFTSDVLQKLRFIRTSRSLGFQLDEIRSLFAEADNGRSPCQEVRNTIRQRISETRQKIDELQVQCGRMQQALAAWESMPDGLPQGDSICRLIESQTLRKKPVRGKSARA